MSTRKKNMIAQKIIALVLLVVMILAIPAFDYDITAHILIVPLCLYMLFTHQEVMKLFQ